MDFQIRILNKQNLDVSDEHFEELLSTFSEDDQNSITKYVFKKDRIQALLSRMLQIYHISESCEMHPNSFKIKRTERVRKYVF